MTENRKAQVVRLCECKSLPDVGINYPCVFNVEGPHIYGCGKLHLALERAERASNRIAAVNRRVRRLEMRNVSDKCNA